MVSHTMRSKTSQWTNQINLVKQAYLSLQTSLSLKPVRKRKRVEKQQVTLTTGLRTVLAIANELILCTDLDMIFRNAVEALREKLDVERCAIFIERDGYFWGTYGTDMHGRTTDEHTNSFPINDVWQERIADLQPNDAQWILGKDDIQHDWDGDKRIPLGTGAIGITPIKTTDGFKGVLFNDRVISARPLDPVEQELLSVFSSMLGRILERKQIEDEIRQALTIETELSELKSRFISNVSHEFRTPLAIVQSSTQLLKYYHDRMDEEKKLQHLEKIEDQVQQMTSLLERVLTISKSETVGLSFNPAPIDLIAFCTSIVEEIMLTTGKSHEIHLLYEPKNFNCSVDEKLLRHILTNLLSNAVKYSPGGTWIQLGLSCDDQQILICVQDQGIGIPAEDLKHLFKDFHRGANVGTISGTGLGLAIVQRATQTHGGEITVESTVGFGTTFTVKIPLILADVPA
jgi:signal transduction histidine kinase